MSITWIIDKHVDRIRKAVTPFVDEAIKRGHKVHALRDSLIPKAIDLTGITISGPTIVRGSHGFVGYVERELNPSPGGFLHPTNFQLSVFAPAIGHYALNNNFQIIAYSDFQVISKEDVFVKPLDEMKKFTGVVVGKGRSLMDCHVEKYNKWFEPDPQCKLVVSSCKKILKEYRVVVVNQTPITGSLYDNQEVGEPPDHVMQTVSDIANIWNPTDVYVVDIAETPVGNKVVEYNQFSTSAMYCCNQTKIMDALEKFLKR